MRVILIIIILTSCATKPMKKAHMDEYTKNEVEPFFRIILEKDEHMYDDNIKLIKENIDFIEFKITKETGAGPVACHTANNPKERKIFIRKHFWDSMHGSRVIKLLNYPIPIYLKKFDGLIIYRYFIVKNALIDCLKYGKKINGEVYKNIKILN